MKRDAKTVTAMFDKISPSYDELNHIFSAFMDIKWRKDGRAILSSFRKKYFTILDIASGSGDMAVQLDKLNPSILISADLSIEMLKINSRKVTGNNYPVLCDADNLPFKDNSFDLCACTFGVRNFINLKKALTEVNRVLKKDAYFMTIEFFKNAQTNFFNNLFDYYFRGIMKPFGNFMTRSKAYNYLYDSIKNFMTPQQYIKLLDETGFDVHYQKNNFLNLVNTII